MGSGPRSPEPGPRAMMATRCPQCGAAFRVAADQLRVRNGLVRCGNCRAIFDGYDSLVDEAQAQEPLRRLPPAVMRNRADMLRHTDDIERADSIGDEPDARPALPPDPYDPDGALSGLPPSAPPLSAAPFVWRRRDAFGEPLDGADDDPRDDDSRDAAPRAAAPAAVPYGLAPDDAELDADGQPDWTVRGEARTRQIDAEDSGRTPPPFMDDERLGQRRRARAWWGVGVLLGLLLLLLQGALVYRTQLALAAPALRPALTALCQPFECRVGHARRAERISIMSSSLQRPSAGAPDNSALVLHVVLRNRYNQPQEWPALMLSLTDLSDTVVARRVVRPAEYLPQPLANGPLSAGQEVSLAIPIDAGKLSVNGYQLDKFFP